MTADPARAAELVQDVFLRVWEKLGTFREEAAFSTWVHRLTVNVVLQATRADRRRRQRVELADDIQGGASEPIQRPPDSGLRIDLEQAMGTLSPLLREVFVLHDVEGYPHQEIAGLLEIPVGTCRSHLFRARRLLREVLA